STNADNTITITQYTGAGGPVAIPATTNGLTVTVIGHGAFSDVFGNSGGSLITDVTIPFGVASIESNAFQMCDNLSSVAIPGSVTNIGYGAFLECASLASLTIPGSVSSIGGAAFSICTSLTNVMIDSGVTSIGSEAFYFCTSLANVTIPGSVTSIGEAAFEYCTSLTNLTIGNGVPSIGQQVFFACTSLANVTIPGSVTNLGLVAFGYCTNLTSVTIPESVTNLVSGVFEQCISLTNVTIPSTVTSIGFEAFFNCASLSSVTIPGSVTSIGVYAFDGCTGLTNVTIPGSVTNIGAAAFGYCVSLIAITVDAQNSFYSSVNGVLFDKSQTMLLQYPGGLAGGYTVPGGVISIASGAFRGTGPIPAGFISVESQAFDGTGLTTVTIPASVTYIGSNAFAECRHLASVFFTGNAPTADSPVFASDNNPTVYYLPGTAGWSSTFGGLSPVLWNPVIQTGDGGFGVRNNQFGFNITGTNDFAVVVEVCTNLANAVWVPLTTNTLVNGLFHFSEPVQRNSSGRFYGLGFP
ncbi:MAG: leucine-rich repeat domain-containing protein, partial [Verrucomicrobiota bacterium]